jgi:hypothetical protein
MKISSDRLTLALMNFPLDVPENKNVKPPPAVKSLVGARQRACRLKWLLLEAVVGETLVSSTY